MQNTRPHTPEEEIVTGFILPDGSKIIFYKSDFEKLKTLGEEE